MRSQTGGRSTALSAIDQRPDLGRKVCGGCGVRVACAGWLSGCGATAAVFEDEPYLADGGVGQIECGK